MNLEVFFIFLILIYLIIASIYDIRTREIPDFLSFSLIGIALTIALAKSIYFLTFSFIVQSLFGLLVFVILSFFLYYTKQWGGGDAKMLMAIGAALPLYPEYLIQYFSPNLNLPFLVIFLVNLVIFGSLYAIIYSAIITFKNRKKIKSFNKSYFLFLYLSIIIFITSFFIKSYSTKLLLTALALIMVFPFLIYFIRIFEKNFMILKIPLSKATEGDWLAENIYHNKKLILDKNTTGLSLQDIRKLKKLNIKIIKIKYGMPFIPSFLISFVISIIFGNFF